ncbi:lactosylceramide 4-alpha-galactosyltransferase-like [Penaeus japonicus]|uniref:lactosylceramide 4-alpha-galactosyltransferase-like n=1 Tax=Penaeus japonicus TaxID=27405 RepID=UPI001C70BB08|nr:lactosylceramide 4-alpha-galactosyltransferase-like [Penaeus japonicus]
MLPIDTFPEFARHSAKTEINNPLDKPERAKPLAGKLQPSWARQNPSSSVWYLMTSSHVDNSDAFPSRLLRANGNLRFASVDAGEIFRGTALQELFESADWFFHSDFPAVVLSDLLRVALVWRLGGFYCDTDTVCLKDTGHLRNVASYAQQDIGKISNFCFHFRAHHRFLDTLMEVQKENFQFLKKKNKLTLMPSMPLFLHNS